MKYFILVVISAVVFSGIGLISGQIYQAGNVFPNQQRDTIKTDLFMPGAYLNDSDQDDYFYNTYEITKLEWEVKQLAAFYRGELFKNAIFNSDKYENLTSEEKKRIAEKLNSLSVSWRYDFNTPDKDLKKSTELYAEDYFNRFIAPYISGDNGKTADKDKLQIEIRRRLEQLFEFKEKERQNRIIRLEKDLADLRASVITRDKNRSEIIEQRFRKLVGVPGKLKW